MNIEDLTKTQLLLLTVLVNFVTSIATGVLTVSLLDQAPPTVIQTVNRIVDNTIETVTREVPVIRNVPSEVPSSEELLTAALVKSGAWNVRLYRSGEELPEGHGLYHASSRSVITTIGNLPENITVEFGDGTRVEAQGREDLGFLKYTLVTDATPPNTPSATFIPLSQVRQGQTAIALAEDRSAVTGIISLVTDEYAKTDIPNLPVGTPLVSLSGEVIGLSLPDGTLLETDAFSATLSP